MARFDSVQAILFYILLLNEKILGFIFRSPEIECISLLLRQNMTKRDYNDNLMCREPFILGLNRTEHMTVRTEQKLTGPDIQICRTGSARLD